MTTTLRIPLDPVPAARIKTGRYGAYYPARYQNFKAAASKLVRVACVTAGILRPLDTLLYVTVKLVVQRPKTTILSHPVGDADNYAKAVLDACNGHVWEDDRQIIGLAVTKEFALPREKGWFEIKIQQSNDIPTFLERCLS